MLQISSMLFLLSSVGNIQAIKLVLAAETAQLEWMQNKIIIRNEVH